MSIEFLDVEDLNSCCRTCLSQNDQLESIFDLFYENVKMTEILEILCNINISEADEYSTRICETCLNRIVDLISFRKMCLESTESLKTAYESRKQLEEEEELTIEEEETIPEEVPENSEEVEIDQLNDLIIESEDENVEIEDDFGMIKQESIDVDEMTSNKFNCAECGESFESSIKLVTHIASHRQQIEEIDKFNENGKRNFACSECDKRFVSPSKVRRHLLAHQREQERIQKYGLEFVLKQKFRPRNYKCPICGKDWESPSKVDRHIRQVHVKNEPLNEQHQKLDNHTDLESVTSEIIEMSPDSLQEVYVYESKSETKSSPKKYECPICGKILGAPSKLNRHMNVHRREEAKIAKFGPDYAKRIKKNHKCEICLKDWESPSKLRRHFRQVHEPKSIKLEMTQDYDNEEEIIIGNEEEHEFEVFS